MIYTVIITLRAVEDLRGIRDYIAKRNPGNARRFLGKMLGEIDKLEHMPDSHPLAPEPESAPFEVRQVIVKPQMAALGRSHRDCSHHFRWRVIRSARFCCGN